MKSKVSIITSIVVATFSLLFMCIFASGCANTTNIDSDKPKIGISMPTKDLQR